MLFDQYNETLSQGDFRKIDATWFQVHPEDFDKIPEFSLISFTKKGASDVIAQGRVMPDGRSYAITNPATSKIKLGLGDSIGAAINDVIKELSAGDEMNKPELVYYQKADPRIDWRRI